jgi:predicted helicase
VSVDTLLDSLSSHGRDFERLCKWMLENAPEYRRKVRRVWLWDEWPGRWGRDAGIDLIAEDREGGLWAVQAKHYDPAYAIKKADLDSFLSESSRPGFTYRLLIASTDHLGPTARRTLDAQEKPVGTVLRSQLEGVEVAWPTDLTDLRPARPERKLPRPHQLRAIDECTHGLRMAERGQLVMACGTGKTLVGAFLAERLGAMQVLVLVPSLSLLGQTLREWATAIDFDDYLAVCSDDTVTKDEQDAVVASTSELGIPVTTDPERIASFLHRPSEKTRVVFATYQSSQRIAAAQTGLVPAFGLVIADEAHRCVGPQAGVFATVLDATKIRAHKRLFMTATPRYFTGRVKREAKEADWEVASMDDPAKFGSVLHRLSFAQAIDQELLSDYQIVVVGVSDDQAHDLAERAAFVTRDEKTVTDARTLARQIGLLRAMANYDMHRVVSFHTRIDHASRFAASLPETNEWLPADRRPTGPLWADHVSGKMSAGERDARLRRLKAVKGDERGLLTNARCLTEGVDVPTLDGVAFIDPRRSQVDVVQAVGRAIRKAKDKTLGTIVIPVFVGGDDDPQVALESSEFDRVWQIVRAMRDHDEALAKELDGLRRELGRRGTLGERPGKIVLDLPSTVGVDFGRAFDAMLVETSTPSWEEGYGHLQRFAEREGNAHVPFFAQAENGYPLGQWVGTQRAFFKRNLLAPTRTERLEALPGWAWSAWVASWEEAYGHLQRFAEREGHARVPRDHVEGGYPLGRWAHQQRMAFKQKRLDSMRAQRLEALPGWTYTRHETVWNEAYDHLQRFAAREGHARVPAAYREDGYPLGPWVDFQRRSFRAGRLSLKRIARLESLPGWTWDTRQTASDSPPR